MYKVTVPVVANNGHFNKEKTLDAIKKVGAERIAIAVSRELRHSFSSDETLAIVRELIEYYKSNGLEVMVWLGETIGHSGGKPYGDFGYTNIRNIEEGDISAFCPMDKNFINDCCEWVKKIAKCGAEMIMLDDDFRLGRRGNMGCCCDLHMEALRKELGEDFEEKDIREKVFSGGGNRYRDAWLKVQGDSLKNLAGKMREALDTVNPDARLGLCCCTDSWDADGTSCIELAKILAGGNRPFMRFTGGPFWCPSEKGATIGDVVEYVRMQSSWCKNEDIEVFSEGDTYPRPRFATSASKLECFDLLLRASGGTDGILKYMLDYVSDADYETGYIDFAVENSELAKEIEKTFADKSAVGVKIRSTHDIIRNAEFDRSEKGLFAKLEHTPILNTAIHFAVRNSLPITYEGDGAMILFGENARTVSEEELKNGAVIDIRAAQILAERGIDTGIAEFGNCDYTRNSFSDVPEEYFIEEEIYVRLSPAVKPPMITVDEKAEIKTEYRAGGMSMPGVFHYENSNGQRFVVHCMDAEAADKNHGWFNGYARMRQLVKSLEWANKKAVPVKADGNNPMLYMLAKENEKGMAVAVCNLFEDKIKNPSVAVNRTFKNIRFINCSGKTAGGKVILDGTLYPYEFAAFEIEY